jgi:uncharacterized protein
MKVVIDTNIIISAILRDRTPEAILIYIIENPAVEWIASTAIVEEYIGVLSRPKFKLPDTLLNRWVEVFQTSIILVQPTETLDFPRDPKDAKFLDCVLFCQADYFITGAIPSTPIPMETTILTLEQMKDPQFLI